MHRTNPAATTVGDGVSEAFNFTTRLALRWLPIAAIAMLVGVVTHLAAAETMALINEMPAMVTPAMGQMYIERLSEAFVPLVGWALLGAIAQMVVGWVAAALTINSLRHREGDRLDPGAVLMAGLRTIGAGLLYGLGLLVFAVVVILPFGMLRGDAIAIAVLVALAAVPAAAYIGVRLSFLSLAIFDGAGVREAFSLSWRISRGAFWRIVGWLLLGALLGGIAALAMVLASSMFGDVTAAAVEQFTTAAIVVFSTAMLGMLYESQRARHGLILPEPIAEEPPAA